MSSRTELITVEVSRPAERLDSYLRERFPAASRGAIQRLIEEGHIRVNGGRVKPTHHPRAGEEIEVHWPEARPAEAQPEEMPLEILFEDADLLVLNKPPGLVVHPAAGHEEHTLVNALLHHCAGELSGIGGVARPGIVHRLDKETSGCLVVAKNDAAHLALAEQFAGRTMEKIYHAIVCGEVARASGEIRAAIARHPSHRKRMAVTDGSGARGVDELPGAGAPARSDAGGGDAAHRPDASNPRPFSTSGASGGGRRDLWRAAKQATGGTDGLHSAAADAARAEAGLHASAQEKENDV